MEEWIEFDGEKTYIHLGKMLKTLFRHSILILFISALCAAAMYMYSTTLITPLYQSSIRMYINNRAEGTDSTNISNADITASQNLVSTYSVILTNHETIDKVIRQTEVNYTYNQLCKMISAKAVNNTEVIQVTVESASAKEAANIANAIADIAPDLISEIVNGSSVRIVDRAYAADKQSSPNIFKYTATGFGLGLLISCILILLIAALKNGLTVEDKLRRDFSDKPVLASIPELTSKRSKKQNDPKTLPGKLNFAAAESYKLLRTNISFCFADNKKCHVIGLTSSTSGEAKSTTAVNFAFSLAQAGNKVCLIDCDLRLPSIYKKLDLQKKPGLVNLLVGQSTGQDVLQKYSVDGTSFYVITNGDVPPNPSELLGSVRMQTVIETLSKNFDYIVLDLNPVGMVSDSLSVSKLLDGMIVIVREDSYDRKIMKESLRMLDSVETNILGIVVTHSTTLQKEYKKHGGKYGYGYGYGYGETAKAASDSTLDTSVKNIR